MRRRRCHGARPPSRRTTAFRGRSNPGRFSRPLAPLMPFPPLAVLNRLHKCLALVLDGLVIGADPQYKPNAFAIHRHVLIPHAAERRMPS
jgi:hypothetical protein